MATLAMSEPTSPTFSKRRPKAWALRCERYCCALATYFPLMFVYSLTTWAVYVEASVGLKPSSSPFIGLPSSILGVVLYLLLNISYTTAVFTDPGSPLNHGARGDRHAYSALPITELPEYTSFTVSSTGGTRFCRKCQCPKPDRAHHCSICKRCVLKMDHHCPWLATCVGLHNYKAFLLFLVYTTLFCLVDFAVSALWIWTEVFNDTRYMDGILPVNVILLSILGGIIGLVLTGFTAYHFSLAARGLTTIEALENTRYVSPLRKALDRHRYEGLLGNDEERNGENNESLGGRLQHYGGQILDAHANAIPGVTGPEEGEEYDSGENISPAQQALSRSYADLERQREQDRYEDYLADLDNERMPHAFDLGWRRNLTHLFGERPLYWFLPMHSTSGNGWDWAPSPKFLQAQERVRERREEAAEQQREYQRDLYMRNMNNGHHWMGHDVPQGYTPEYPTGNLSYPNHWTGQQIPQGYPPEYPTGNLSYPDRPPTGVSMKTLPPRSPRPRPGEENYDDVDSDGFALEPSHGKGGNQHSREDEWRDWDE